jgi:hypothetical protein
MSEKKFSPYEVAMAILAKSQEIYNKHSELKKAEVCKEEMEKCGESKVVGKGEDLKKIGGASATTGQGGGSLPGSVATTGGPSISSQIGFGKGEDKKEHSGAVGDVDPKIISDMKAKLSSSKKDKKLPDFLKKKKLKKADGAPQAPEAAAGSPSNSPQSPKVAAGGLPSVKKPEVK